MDHDCVGADYRVVPYVHRSQYLCSRPEADVVPDDGKVAVPPLVWTTPADHDLRTNHTACADLGLRVYDDRNPPVAAARSGADLSLQGNHAVEEKEDEALAHSWQEGYPHPLQGLSGPIKCQRFNVQISDLVRPPNRSLRSVPSGK